MKRFGVYAMLLLAICAGGCARQINEDIVRVRVLPSIDGYKDMRRVALIPLGEYHAGGGKKVVMGIPHKVVRDNGKIMSEILSRELRDRVRFELIPPGRVARELKKEGLEAWGVMGREKLRRVGELLGADALIMGNVEEFSTYRYKTYEQARVAVRLCMVGVDSGESVWEGNFQLDQEGDPLEVARRGARLLIEQLLSR